MDKYAVVFFVIFFTILLVGVIWGLFSALEKKRKPQKVTAAVDENQNDSININSNETATMSNNDIYTAAIEKLRVLHKDWSSTGNRAAKEIEEAFPEIFDSEDERIRKALIKLVKKAGEGYENVIDGVSIENALAWLEKQGMQKDILKDATLDNNEDGLIAATIKAKDEQNPIKWSKYDNDMMRYIIDDIHCGSDFNPEVMHAANEREKWFKSICLRCQSHWKPTEEQIYELSKAVDYYTSHGFPNKIINELLEQIKNL
jgi:cbb3-type cytochrome oxidase subunit 3